VEASTESGSDGDRDRALIRDPSAARSIRSNVGGGIVLLFLAALAFWPVASGSRSFLHGDLRYEHVPIWHVTQQALLAGESPFWLEGFYCGHPLLFTQEAPLFYPLTVPLLLTGAPAHRLADLFSLFHFWLAGFAAFLLLRDIRSDFSSSLFGGIAWMLSARMVQSALWPNSVAVSALLPLVLLGLLRIGRGRRRSGVMFVAATGGLALSAARPQVLLSAAPLLAVLVAATLVLAARRGEAVRDVLFAGTLALLLGAPSLLPSALLYPATSRAGGLTPADRDPYPLTFAGDVDQVFLPVDGPLRWPEAAAYPGVLAGLLFLGGLGLLRRRDSPFPRALFLALLAGGALGLAFAFGERGPYALFDDLPLLRGFRSPVRFLFSWSLAVALGSALVLRWILLRARRPRLLAAAAIAVLAVDLVVHARRAAPTGPSDLYSIRPKLAGVLEQKLTRDESGFPRRFWSLTDAIPFWLYDDASKLSLARSLEPLSGAIGMRWGLESINGAGPPLARTAMVFGTPGLPAARLGGAGLLVMNAPRSPDRSSRDPAPLVVQPFAAALPRALVVPEAIVVPPPAAVAAALDPARDPRRTAVLEEGDPLDAEPRATGSHGTVRLISRSRSRVELSAELPSNGILVLYNSFERGWNATLNGKPAPVLRADAAFLGVRLPAGTHRVRFEYSPRGLFEGAALGVVGLLGLVLAAIRLPADAAEVAA
jgi:hypothetical protein